jgi:hypothetical protein
VCKYRSCFCSYAELIRPARQSIRRRHKSKHRSVFVSTGNFRCASVNSSSLRALQQDDCRADTMNRLPKRENNSGTYLLPLFRLDYTSRTSTGAIKIRPICLIASSISNASTIFQANIHILFFCMVCTSIPFHLWFHIQGAF